MIKYLICFFVLVLLLFVKCEYAISNTISQSPIYIEYNHLFYDQNNEVIIFKGEVVVVQDNEILTADELHYHKKENKYYAIGNVAILKEGGNVYFADIVNLDRVLYQGRGLNFKGRLGEQGLIAASVVEMYNKDEIAMNNAVFSTCKVCDKGLFPNIPMWQIRAKEAYLDRNKESITYKNASLEAFGVPFMYTPYMVTPTPGAQRKSGFLSPTLRWSNDFGFMLGTPYYWNIAPNMDTTIALRSYTNENPLLEGEFRHIFEGGGYELKGSIIDSQKNLKKAGNMPHQKQVRGHVDFKSLYKVDNTKFDTYIGLDAMRVYDKNKTYLKKYKISDEDVLTTNAFVRNFWDEGNYAFLDSLYFQSLKPEASWKTSPRIVPWFRGHYNKDLSYHNSELFLDTDILNLTRAEGQGYQRVSSTIGYKIPFILPYGQLLRINSSLRGDTYQVSRKTQNKAPLGKQRKGTAGRVYPELNLEWSLPLAKYSNFGTFVIEPVANMIIASDHHPSKIIPNEDSHFFELTATNLFSNNRYLGHDQLETGSRFNYGIRGNFKNKYIENIGFTVGEVINFKKHDFYPTSSGLTGKKSDYVSKIYFQPIKEIYIGHKLRVNQEKTALMRQEIYTTLNLPKWNITINYMEIGKSMLKPGENIYRKDIMSSAAYNIYDRWWVGGYIKRKFGEKVTGAGKKIAEGVHVNYLGDCLHTFFTVERDHTKLNDLKPSTTYAFNIKIPNF